MKLPKGFGGQGMGDMMANMRGAMERAQTLEDELGNERIDIRNSGVEAVFDGRGELVDLKIDKGLVDPDDVEGLCAAITATMRMGFEKAVEVRDARVKDIMGNVPNIPGLGL